MPASGAEIADDVAARSVPRPLAEQKHDRRDRTVLPASEAAATRHHAARFETCASSPFRALDQPSGWLPLAETKQAPSSCGLVCEAEGARSFFSVT